MTLLRTQRHLMVNKLNIPQVQAAGSTACHKILNCAECHQRLPSGRAHQVVPRVQSVLPRTEGEPDCWAPMPGGRSSFSVLPCPLRSNCAHRESQTGEWERCAEHCKTIRTPRPSPNQGSCTASGHRIIQMVLSGLCLYSRRLVLPKPAVVTTQALRRMLVAAGSPQPVSRSRAAVITSRHCVQIARWDTTPGEVARARSFRDVDSTVVPFCAEAAACG